MHRKRLGIENMKRFSNVRLYIFIIIQMQSMSVNVSMNVIYNSVPSMHTYICMHKIV